MLHETLGTTTTNRPHDLGHRHTESFRPTTALPGEIAKGGLAGWQLRKVVQHIEDNLAGPLSCHDLAAAARLSTGHFCRAFKASMGEPPHAYVIRQRIRRAQRLMLQTDDALSQIACLCGLTDQAHLTRLFRRMVGTTPKVWRNRWKPLSFSG